MNLFERFQLGHSQTDFLAKYGSATHQNRWKATTEAVIITPQQRSLLTSFKREMNLMVLAGAWCGDCSSQCPILDCFATVTPLIRVRYLDNADHADVQQELSINGGKRVPVVVFFSEDGFEVARYGERTLSRYRKMVGDLDGASCATGIITPGDTLLAQVTQEWLNEVERVQWLLRLSTRLRQKHGD